MKKDGAMQGLKLEFNFLYADNFNIGFFNGKEVCPRSITDKIKARCSYNNHFCLIEKSDGVSFFKKL